MNLDALDRALVDFLAEAGVDPDNPTPQAAWPALIRLAAVPVSIGEPADDFLRFEASTGTTGVDISLSRELMEASGETRGSVGCDFTIALVEPNSKLDAVIECDTEPEYLSLGQFVAAVEATSAFRLLQTSVIARAARWAEVIPS